MKCALPLLFLLYNVHTCTCNYCIALTTNNTKSDHSASQRKAIAQQCACSQFKFAGVKIHYPVHVRVYW